MLRRLRSKKCRYVDTFLKLCHGLNVKPITRVLAVRGSALENYDLLVKEVDKGKEDGISEKVNMLCLCNAGISTLSFDANGNINLCPTIEPDELSLGGIRNLYSLSDKIEKLSSECIVDTIEPCKNCIVRYFCSSMCYSMNINVFTNSDFRIKRCTVNREALIKSVWGMK